MGGLLPMDIIGTDGSRNLYPVTVVLQTVKAVARVVTRLRPLDCLAYEPVRSVGSVSVPRSHPESVHPRLLSS